MSGPSDFEASFARGLWDGTLPQGSTAPDPSEAAQRFKVYRNNVMVSLIAALGQRFPVIAALLGREAFDLMARHYATQSPPARPMMAEWGDSLPAYLDGLPQLVDYPYMGDVARIEYARGVSYHAADAVPIAPERLQGADPARLQLGLPPSVQILRLTHPAVSIWQRHQPGKGDTPLGAGPESALIYRTPGFDVSVHAISTADAALIDALGAGSSLLDAAQAALEHDPTHQAQPLLVTLMQGGALVERTST